MIFFKTPLAMIVIIPVICKNRPFNFCEDPPLPCAVENSPSPRGICCPCRAAMGFAKTLVTTEKPAKSRNGPMDAANQLAETWNLPTTRLFPCNQNQHGRPCVSGKSPAQFTRHSRDPCQARRHRHVSLIKRFDLCLIRDRRKNQRVLTENQSLVPVS